MADFTVDTAGLNIGDVLVYKGNYCFGSKTLCECLAGCSQPEVDRCEMVAKLGLKPGQHLAVNAAGDCIEGVEPPTPYKCGMFKVSAEDGCCDYAVKKFCSSDGSILINEVPGNGDCTKLDFKVAPGKCVSFCDLCEIAELVAPECDMSFWGDIYDCIKTEAECEPCETTCMDYYQIEYCPDSCKVRIKEDPCCDPCRKHFAGKNLQKTSITICVENQKEYKYYLTEKRIPQLDAAGWRWIGGVPGASFSELAGGGESATSMTWENEFEDHCIYNKYGGLFVPQIGKKNVTYTGSFETNKAIHGSRNVFIVIDCVTGDITTPGQWRDSGVQGTKYSGQPEAPATDGFGTQGCNDTTTAYSGPQVGDTTVATYSMGRDTERRSFIAWDLIKTNNPVWIIPGIKISSVVTGDDDATKVKGQVSLIGGDSNTADGGDDARLVVENADGSCDLEMMRRKCIGDCCCSLDCVDCNIFDEQSEFGAALPFELPGTGGSV